MQASRLRLLRPTGWSAGSETSMKRGAGADCMQMLDDAQMQLGTVAAWRLHRRSVSAQVITSRLEGAQESAHQRVIAPYYLSVSSRYVCFTGSERESQLKFPAPLSQVLASTCAPKRPSLSAGSRPVQPRGLAMPKRRAARGPGRFARAERPRRALRPCLGTKPHPPRRRVGDPAPLSQLRLLATLPDLNM